MKSLGTPELQSRIAHDEKLVLVNVLPPSKFQVTCIPGSVNVPLGADFAQRVERHLGTKDKPIVVYGTDSTCESSQKAADALENAGFTDVAHYTGGAKAWAAKGGVLSSLAT